MSDAERIAGELEAANGAVLDLVRAAAHTPVWLRPVRTPTTERSFAALVHHIASGYDRGLRWAMAIRDTHEMPEVTAASLRAENAEHAAAYNAPTPEQCEQVLNGNAGVLLELLAGLDDFQLSLTARNVVLGHQWSVRDALERTVAHTREHAAELQAVLAA